MSHAERKTIPEEVRRKMSEGHKRRNAVVAEALAARDAKAAQRAIAQAEALEITRKVAQGELTAAEAVPLAEAVTVMLRMTMVEGDEGVAAFEAWLEALRRQAARGGAVMAFDIINPETERPLALPPELADENDTNKLCDLLLHWFDPTNVVVFPGCEFRVRPHEWWQFLVPVSAGVAGGDQ